MKKLKLIPLLCALCMMLLLGGCNMSEDKGISDKTNNKTTTAEEEKDYMTIDTDYGQLKYPDQWQDLIKTSQKYEEDTLVVTFKTKIKKKNYKLFAVKISEDKEQSLGSIKDVNGKKRYVTLETFEIPEDSKLDEGEQRRLYAMQEDLNYLLDSLDK